MEISRGWRSGTTGSSGKIENAPLQEALECCVHQGSACVAPDAQCALRQGRRARADVASEERQAAGAVLRQRSGSRNHAADRRGLRAVAGERESLEVHRAVDDQIPRSRVPVLARTQFDPVAESLRARAAVRDAAVDRVNPRAPERERLRRRAE